MSDFVSPPGFARATASLRWRRSRCCPRFEILGDTGIEVVIMTGSDIQSPAHMKIDPVCLLQGPHARKLPAQTLDLRQPFPKWMLVAAVGWQDFNKGLNIEQHKGWTSPAEVDDLHVPSILITFSHCICKRALGTPQSLNKPPFRSLQEFSL